MLYNFIRWCCFLLAVVVEGDESSWPRIANWRGVLAVALIDSPRLQVSECDVFLNLIE